jgi:L-alanine-DL-glutamate epimerase-like enolase superfamily enzyme
MKINKIEIFGLPMALNEPFIISYTELYDLPVILLRMETEDGTVGWGESVPDPFVTGETWESTFETLKYTLSPLIIGENPFNINQIHKKMDGEVRHVPAAKAAVDLALYDLIGKITHQPVYHLIGGKAHSSLDIPNVISILPPEDMAQKAEEISNKGIKHVKIKVGTDVETDIARIQQVRQALPKETKLRVDANQGWSVYEAIRVIDSTRDCSVEWYEQPTKAGDHKAMAEVRSATHAHIMADESVHGVLDLIDMHHNRSADSINIKLMKTGGIHPALKLSHLADELNMYCQVGSMVETAIATMAGAHLAISQGVIGSNEMVGPLMFKEDVAATTYTRGEIIVTDQPGFGIEVDEHFVRGKAVKYCSI